MNGFLVLFPKNILSSQAFFIYLCSYEELKRFLLVAEKLHLEIIPLIPTLGHFEVSHILLLLLLFLLFLVLCVSFLVGNPLGIVELTHQVL